MGLAETAQLAVRIGLDDKLSPGLAKTSRNLGNFEKGLGRTGKGVAQVGTGLLKTGVIAAGIAAGGLTLAAKKAIEMDDAFAAVRKTVESATTGELQALNDQLHALATRIPVQYTDLAAIAAEAGALGVPTKSVAKFTETVARLSASTQGLSVEAAAEAFGKFRNVLHITDSQLTNTASALIALGNAGASSEADIIEVGKRFAAAGHLAGLSAADVLAFSSAITSLGVQPEAAGSSLSRLFNNITKYIGTGDKKIQAFAKTSGVSVKEFSRLFSHDAKGAVLDFLKGLSGLNKFQATAVLKNAGITNVRDINAVLLLSQNYGELSRQLGVSEDAFKKNTALADVSAKRFDTLKNKIAVLRNNFQEAGYEIATGFLPALGRAVDKFTAFLQDPKNKDFLQGLGRDLGKALDRIDFDKLLKLGQGLVKALDPALQLVLKLGDLISSLPPELVGAGGTLLIANKVSGGAISSGIGNIIGGLGETFARTLLSQVPLFGRAFVQPVFVTNIGGLGGGVGGDILGGLAGAAEGGGLLAGGITVALTAGTIAAFGIALHDAISNHPNADGAVALDANGNVKPGQVFSTQHGFGRPPNQTAALNAANGVTPRDMDKNLEVLGPATRDMDKNLQSSAQVLKNLEAIGIKIPGYLQASAAQTKALRDKLVSISKREANALKTGNKPQFDKLIDTEHQLVHKAAHQGDLTLWLGSLNRREALATRTHNGAWLSKLNAKEALIRAAITRQTSSTGGKLQALRAANQKTTSAAIQTRDAIRHKDLSVKVNVSQNVSVSAINNGQRTTSRVTRNGSFLVAS